MLGDVDTVRCDLLHHGAAANSSPKVIACINRSKSTTATTSNSDDKEDGKNASTELVYASNLILNIMKQRVVPISYGVDENDDNKDSTERIKIERIWTVTQTLRTSTSTEAESATAAANVSTLTAKRVITCVVPLKRIVSTATTCNQRNATMVVLLCGFSDGTLTCWLQSAEGEQWTEQVLPDLKSSLEGRSVTDVDGYCDEGGKYLSIVTCSSGGAHFFGFEDGMLVAQKRLVHTPSNAVKYHVLDQSFEHQSEPNGRLGVFLVGTAAPRHNKIHVLAVPSLNEAQCTASTLPVYSGSLTGHEDWITCFDWTMPVSNPGNNNNNSSYLASGSQDARIRLWKWVTTTTTTDVRDPSLPNVVTADETEQVYNDDDDDDDEEMIEGEARLEILHGKNLLTSVYLEALLIGHEEMVTSVAWHPDPRSLYNEDLILVSASMDRMIFIWSCTDSDGGQHATNTDDAGDSVWTTIARVGSAGGILGGSVGSSLLGFLHVEIEPFCGRWIMGHAYGGALHFFSCESSSDSFRAEGEGNGMTIEERAALVQWRAQPCVTGHFSEITDLAWEACHGDYLVTVGDDQTCRVWAPLKGTGDVWVEIARPQVHGYNLSAVTSLSTPEHRDLLVTGADEKEIRVFDGTRSFLRTLELVTGLRSLKNNLSLDIDSRAERAYIPALGLTNKASAADGADEDTSGASMSSTLLLLERDLGSTSLWPETRKLFGHNSEIARLISTLSARTALSVRYSTPYFNDILVASSTKARDIETANIRLWDVEKSRCIQVLKGGHRSTVTALSFSPDGTYVASSGKDRRLCIWKRRAWSAEEEEPFFLASAVDVAHKRIVWSVNFSPRDPSVLASGSRDGTVKLWKLTEKTVGIRSEFQVKEYIKFVPVPGDSSKDRKPEAITSLAFSPINAQDTRGLLALGFEDGLLQLWSVPIRVNAEGVVSDGHTATLLTLFNPHICHIGAICKIAWKPVVDDESHPLILASGSSDCGCRVFRIDL